MDSTSSSQLNINTLQTYPFLKHQHLFLPNFYPLSSLTSSYDHVTAHQLSSALALRYPYDTRFYSGRLSQTWKPDAVLDYIIIIIIHTYISKDSVWFLFPSQENERRHFFFFFFFFCLRRLREKRTNNLNLLISLFWNRVTGLKDCL